MIFTDTHSHIYDEAFDEDRDEAVARALSAGVTRMFLPAVDKESYGAMMALAERYPQNCFPMIGLHPTSVNDNPDFESDMRRVEQMLREDSGRRFCAIGEVGLDLYWSRDWESQQRVVFERQVELSLEYNLPLVIHTRDAWAEMVETLRRYKGRGVRGVMHAFAGSVDDYNTIKECGDFVFGIGGVVTYKKSVIAEIVPRMSLDDLVLETDAPYLTPVPYRGKRNESSYIPIIAQKVAELLGEALSEVADRTTRNSKRIFGV